MKNVSLLPNDGSTQGAAAQRVNRRRFLQTALVAAGGVISRQVSAQSKGSKPNLLYILVDQLSGLALPGIDPNAHMPHTRRLMDSGIVFTHAYTGGMTCGPSRACLDTGLYTQAHSIGGGYRPPASMDTLPKTLAGNGYVLS